MSDLCRCRIHITGIVQGVGLRPHVFKLATSLDLVGFVLNGSDGVHIEVEGRESQVHRFLCELSSEGPRLAAIDSISTEEIQPTRESCRANALGTKLD
jgi:hydrogenase maturation protein HypF